MNLDDIELFIKLDPGRMLAEIQNLPAQLSLAWKIADQYPLPDENHYSKIIIAGMGGSAIGADLLISFVTPLCDIPVNLIRGYHLPYWAKGKDVLVICSSHSGNTEEVISVFNEAIENQCTILCVSRGGQLLNLAKDNQIVGWKFDHAGQPRSAVGFSFGMLFKCFSRLKLIPDQTTILKDTVSKMQEYLNEINADVPVSSNLAKRIAGQAIIDTW